MRVGSLFSGIGGIELGLERAGGFTTAWFVEQDPYAQAVLKKHWPNATIYEDITSIDFTSVQRVDVLTGGFPCQDISNAGKRVGITGNRSGLWKHYLRAISVLRPHLVLAENVAALTQRGLDTVLCDLTQIGYDAEWHCVPAASVGAPHRRDRIIIMAYPQHDGLATTARESEAQRVEQQQGWTEEQKSTQQSSGSDTRPLLSTDVANAECEGLASATDVGRREEQPRMDAHQEKRPTLRGVISASDEYANREHVSDAMCSGLPNGDAGTDCERPHPELAGADCGREWEGWAVEPGVGRVAHGIPKRVDRLKCLGNAVVPQWAQAIGEAIKEVKERDAA